MKKLKMRVWHKEEKVMLYHCPEVSSGNSITSKGDMHSQKSFVRWDGLLFNDGVVQNKNVEILLATGLLDCKDKEIWEGDIVEAFYGEQKQPLNQLSRILGRVEWYRFGFYFEFGIGIMSKYKSLNDVDGNGEICWREEYPRATPEEVFFRIKDIKVIGNIYENPKLIDEYLLCQDKSIT